jgi:hypothetical protein
MARVRETTSRFINWSSHLFPVEDVRSEEEVRARTYAEAGAGGLSSASPHRTTSLYLLGAPLPRARVHRRWRRLVSTSSSRHRRLRDRTLTRQGNCRVRRDCVFYAGMWARSTSMTWAGQRTWRGDSAAGVYAVSSSGDHPGRRAPGSRRSCHNVPGGSRRRRHSLWEVDGRRR